MKGLGEDKKKWYKSKTIWANVIALGGLVVARQFGFEISPEESGGVLVVINLVFRAISGIGLET